MQCTESDGNSGTGPLSNKCIVHNQEAKVFTSTKSVWPKIKKTGLFAYRGRKLSVLRCDGHMRTYLGTMDRLDGAGETEKSMGGQIEYIW